MSMGVIFLKLLNMSITASWLILAVVCIRFLFRKIPKWILCLLWGVVAIRLIFPFSVESIFSLQPSAEPIKTSTMIEGEIVPYVPSIDSNLRIVENTVNPLLTETFAYPETDSVAPLQIVTSIAGNLWLFGMIVLLIFAAVSVVRLQLSVREAVRYKENIYICDDVKTPFILGVMKPRIYLPSSLKKDEMAYIIAHEKAHLRRKDYLWKPLGYLLLNVYWFNPLCWMAYIMLCKDIEMACDEKVIQDMSFGDKKAYSRVLLSCASQRRLVLSCPLAFGEVGVKERVKSVLYYKRPAFWITVTAIIVCAVVAVCFLTNPQKEYQIRITIPAGSTEEIIYQEQFCYSDEEVSPIGNKITISLGEGIGDTEVVLKPIEVKEENAYEPTYITPGMPVKMDVEKGAWFKIGVNMQNPTTEDIDVYVNVRNVKVRIANDMPTEEERNDSMEETPDWITEVINVEKRDVTHDGVEDYIVTSMTYDSNYMDENAPQMEKIAQQVRYDLIDVKVYEGTNASNPYSEQTLLWSQEYSSVHAGNGQLSIVQVDDKDYILTSNLWAGQGLATWEFEVFSLNETGDKSVIDNQSVEFKLEEDEFADEEYYAEFKHSLEKYIADGILIVACDIDLEQQFVRTQESLYIPQNYYSQALVKFDKAEYFSEDEKPELNVEEKNANIQDENIEKPESEVAMIDTSVVSSIALINGNTGERKTLAKGDAGYSDLLKLYWSLNFSAEYEENSRVGYQYRMILQDTKGNKLQSITPYKDGVIVDSIFLKYDNKSNDAASSLRLMEYLEYICNSEQSLMAKPITEVPVNTLENVTMKMYNYNDCEGNIEITNRSGSEITTGEWYSIQRYEDGEWHRLDELIDVVWTAIEYCIPDGETTEFPTNWKTRYGELPIGEYRIVKEAYLHLEERIETYYLATEFALK